MQEIQYQGRQSERKEKIEGRKRGRNPDLKRIREGE
jgi:hypothetical protein